MTTAIISGDDRTLTLTVTGADGLPQDLTGLGVEFRLENLAGAVVSKTVGAGITLLAQSGATLGQATVSVDGVDTAGAGSNERWDVEVRVTSGADRVTALQTQFAINPETT